MEEIIKEIDKLPFDNITITKDSEYGSTIFLTYEDFSGITYSIKYFSEEENIIDILKDFILFIKFKEMNDFQHDYIDYLEKRILNRETKYENKK